MSDEMGVVSDERGALEGLYADAIARRREGVAVSFPESAAASLGVIIERQEGNKGVLAVLLTLLLKKIVTPEQDIRLHQDGMDGGFSGRGLDTRVVTPFLKDHNFPSMSESGWLTRSLEQGLPYDLNYPGSIRPAAVKGAFLAIVNDVQTQGVSAEAALLRLLIGLIEHRERSANIILDRPVNLSIDETVDKLRRHYGRSIPGAARLPTLAIHAILTVLARETRERGRYANCEVLPLEHHNAADSRTRSIGDVSVADAEGNPFEGYEIKHNIPITHNLVRDSVEKFRTTPVQRYYILTTHIREDYSEFDEQRKQVADSHGCELIVNGVERTLLYYLRLIRGTRDFVNEYVSNLETDPSVSFDLKMAWNEIVRSD